MKAIGRQLRITSKKINLIADLVRKKDAKMAMDILKFTPKKGARILGKIVRSAVANAENNFKQETASLFVKEIIVTEGSTLKRSVPISRGRVHPILKRMAHVTVILGVRDADAAAAPTKKAKAGAATPETTAEEAKKTTVKTPAKKAAPAKKPAAKKGVKTIKA